VGVGGTGRGRFVAQMENTDAPYVQSRTGSAKTANAEASESRSGNKQVKWKKNRGYLLCRVGVGSAAGTGEGAGGKGGDGGGVEARGGEGVLREGRGQGTPPRAVADEGAGEAGEDPDDEEHADAEAEQRERGVGGHGARHGGGGEEEEGFQWRRRGMGNASAFVGRDGCLSLCW
jgi:hypothetical protein